MCWFVAVSGFLRGLTRDATRRLKAKGMAAAIPRVSVVAFCFADLLADELVAAGVLRLTSFVSAAIAATTCARRAMTNIQICHRCVRIGVDAGSNAPSSREAGLARTRARIAAFIACRSIVNLFPNCSRSWLAPHAHFNPTLQCMCCASSPSRCRFQQFPTARIPNAEDEVLP
jgi:hypothetical protein